MFVHSSIHSINHDYTWLFFFIFSFCFVFIWFEAKKNRFNEQTGLIIRHIFQFDSIRFESNQINLRKKNQSLNFIKFFFFMRYMAYITPYRSYLCFMLSFHHYHCVCVCVWNPFQLVNVNCICCFLKNKNKTKIHHPIWQGRFFFSLFIYSSSLMNDDCKCCVTFSNNFSFVYKINVCVCVCWMWKYIERNKTFDEIISWRNKQLKNWDKNKNWKNFQTPKYTMTDNYYSFVNFGLGLFTNFFNLFEIPKNFLLYQNLFQPIDQFFRLATGQLSLVVNFFWSILKSPFVFGTSSSSLVLMS